MFHLPRTAAGIRASAGIGPCALPKPTPPHIKAAELRKVNRGRMIPHPSRCSPTARGELALLLGPVIASGHDLVHGLVARWRGEQ